MPEISNTDMVTKPVSGIENSMFVMELNGFGNTDNVFIFEKTTQFKQELAIPILEKT